MNYRANKLQTTEAKVAFIKSHKKRIALTVYHIRNETKTFFKSLVIYQLRQVQKN